MSNTQASMNKEKDTNSNNNQAAFYRDSDTFYTTKELKLLDHSVSSPTNHQTPGGNAVVGVIPNGSGTGPDSFDSQFEIMNARARGIEQLFNEEDRNKIKGMQEQIRGYLEDITTENNDQYGYLSGRLAQRLAKDISDEMKTFS
jgi:hypothetical protein